MSRYIGLPHSSTYPQALRFGLVLATALFATVTPHAASAQGAPPPAAPPAQSSAAPAAAPTAAPDVLVLHFNTGSVAIRPDDTALLDQASRLYRDAHPILMIVTAGSDTVGAPEQNLRLSQARADAVLHALVTRGIPAERFQLLAKGVSDLTVPTPSGTAEERNRRVEIRWR